MNPSVVWLIRKDWHNGKTEILEAFFDEVKARGAAGRAIGTEWCISLIKREVE